MSDMNISESELVAMTKSLEEMHQATLPTMRASMLDLGSDLRRAGSAAGAKLASRRALLAGGSAVVGGLVLAACGGKSSSSGVSASPSASAHTDISALSTDASIEALAIFAYDAALKAAPMGKFGKSVPAAVATFATVAKQQHMDHLDAFNAAIKGAGGTAFTKPDPALAPTVTQLFGQVTNVVDLAKLALTLENTAAATYIQQMGALTSPAALAAVATIAPVEQQHSAILNFVIGEYPVPDTFVKLGKTATSLGARPSNEAGV